MTISHTTFKQTFRERLLDILYDQWRQLGATFSGSNATDVIEVIDPEALLWCSFEFIPAEPRLLEAVVSWLKIRSHYIIRQRLRTRTQRSDPRGLIWQTFEQLADQHPRRLIDRRDEEASSPQLRELLSQITHWRNSIVHGPKSFSSYAKGPSTLQLRARDLLGNDPRHFFLLYLLVSPHGAKLRDICDWSGYSYRSIFELASRWETAEAVSLTHGFCRLLEPEPWQSILKCRTEQYLLVDWFRIFGASVELLRAITKAEEKGLGSESAVVGRLRQDTLLALHDPLVPGLSGDTPTAAALRSLFPDVDRKAIRS